VRQWEKGLLIFVVFLTVSALGIAYSDVSKTVGKETDPLSGKITVELGKKEDFPLLVEAAKSEKTLSAFVKEAIKPETLESQEWERLKQECNKLGLSLDNGAIWEKDGYLYLVVTPLSS